MKTLAWAAGLVLALAPALLQADNSAAVSQTASAATAVPLTPSPAAVPPTPATTAVPLSPSTAAGPRTADAEAGHPAPGSMAAAPPAAPAGPPPPRPQDRSPAPLVWDSHHRLVVAVVVPDDPSRWSQSGLEYRFSLGVLKLPNGQALSYTPLEMGWRFPDGWRLRFGAEFFYYVGYDQDSNTKSQGLGPQEFYYQMEDFRLSALYEWPWRSRIRPLAGMTFESVFGTRELSYSYSPSTPTAPANAKEESANGFEAPGAEVGLEYRGGRNWSLSLEARYVIGLGYWANMAGTDLGMHYLF